jgi:lauroyl/myristoyl acyltransferase
MPVEPNASGEPTGRRVEPREVRLSPQSIRAKPVPAFIRHDAYFLLSLPWLVPIAALVDLRHWPTICRFFARVSPVGRRRRSSIRAGLREAFAGDASVDGPAIDRIGEEIEAQRFELDLQILRGLLRRNWRPKVRLEGADRLAAAVADGRGAILWIGKSAFSDTIAKIGLAAAGYPPVHLSQTNHGISHSRFAQRWLNPLQRRVEDRYLAERVILNDAAPSGALRRLQRVLARNGIVSIAVEPWGSHAADVRVLGGRLRIATGAPSLAWKTGAKLMPVFVAREADGGFRVLVDEPLSIGRGQSKQDAQRIGVAEYASRLERILRAAPAEWRDWPRVRALTASGGPPDPAAPHP